MVRRFLEGCVYRNKNKPSRIYYIWSCTKDDDGNFHLQADVSDDSNPYVNIREAMVFVDSSLLFEWSEYGLS
jgi:hypothetical protein